MDKKRYVIYVKSILKHMIEIGISVWVIICIYFFWIINGSIGMEAILKIHTRVVKFNEDNNKFIRPLIYRDYIFKK